MLKRVPFNLEVIYNEGTESMVDLEVTLIESGEEK